MTARASVLPQDYLATESIDDLVSLLRKARLDTHLLDLFPPQKRTLADLDEHFKVVPRATHPSHPPEAPSLHARPAAVIFALNWSLQGALRCGCTASLLCHGRRGCLMLLCFNQSGKYHGDRHEQLPMCLCRNMQGAGGCHVHLSMCLCPGMQGAGLERLVEYNRKKQEEVHLQELKVALAESITADPPLPVSESIRIVHDAKKEWQLPDTEVIKVLTCHFTPPLHAALTLPSPWHREGLSGSATWIMRSSMPYWTPLVAHRATDHMIWASTDGLLA